DLLEPVRARSGKPALVEMSCFTIAAAPALGRIFPEARFVHSVRDGRDSGSSKVSKRQKVHHPTDDPGRLLTLSLDGLVHSDRERTYDSLLQFLGIDDEPDMRRFFDEDVSGGA